jgi:hypothetical protein
MSLAGRRNSDTAICSDVPFETQTADRLGQFWKADAGHFSSQATKQRPPRKCLCACSERWRAGAFPIRYSGYCEACVSEYSVNARRDARLGSITTDSAGVHPVVDGTRDLWLTRRAPPGFSVPLRAIPIPTSIEGHEPGLRSTSPSAIHVGSSIR